MALLFSSCLAWLFLLLQTGYCGVFQDITKQETVFVKGLRHNVLSDELFLHYEGFQTGHLDIANETASCEDDLGGFGSFDNVCTLNESVTLEKDASIVGDGSFILLDDVHLSCPVQGCIISINLSGEVFLEASSSIVAGTIIIGADNVTLARNASLNTTTMAGSPPPQTSGTPLGLDGAGGGYGGRGAFCLKGEIKDQEDVWGGDVYSWSSLSHPWSYGSQGGTTSREEELGGGGGGRIFIATTCLKLDGMLLADGGYAGISGGGGSGGSIMIQVSNLNGSGTISASGGTGWAGGGGGRVAIQSAKQEGVLFYIHGGDSLGCPNNSGAAGTRFDVVTKSLMVDNSNKSTQTDTIFMEFPTYPPWENVFLRNYAKVAIPLLWSRVQVQGLIFLKSHAILSSGLAHYPYSEFELLADDVEVIDSTLKVYGALRLSVKMLRMQNSILQIDSSEGEDMVASSTIDASNLVSLQKGSVISSKSNLGVRGQGIFQLRGQGDAVKAQRLFVSLFYNVNIGPKAMLQALLTEDDTRNEAPSLYCDQSTCPFEIIQPPEDCNLNTSLPFTLQICRVEDVVVNGLVTGSVIHIHRARTVTIREGGVVTASERGCHGGLGKAELSSSGAAGGAGHGGKGGKGYYNGSWAVGGEEYGSKMLPCELGSGSGNITSGRSTSGGGLIVIGSMEHAVSNLEILGAVTCDAESFVHSENESSGVGGGSGGSLLFFLQTLELGNDSLLSTSGGNGSAVGGGGGGGGRIHFHWSNIAVGEDYVPIASVNGLIVLRGGPGDDYAMSGENGTMTGIDCPPGLFGVFCEECPIGFYKDEYGSDARLCKPCSIERLPQRANFTYIRGGGTISTCPYKCISDKYRMPYCYTPLQELIYTFGGPWVFSLILVALLVLLALVLSVARVKLMGADESLAISRPGVKIDHSVPFLESLTEVLQAARAEESQNHVHRLYFMGCNSFSEPWHLAHTPPKQIMEIIYEDAFNRFVDEINSLASYQWWEGTVHGMIAVLAYPLAYSWKQWCRSKKFQQLREYVRSEYDHSCLRSCRSRALYEGLKVAAAPDLMLAYIDFFVGGDEKRPDLPHPLSQRLPFSIIFSGDGSYMPYFCLHNDNLLTRILSEAVPATIWYRFVAGLNAQLRTVRRGSLKRTLLPVIDWLESHANPHLSLQGVHVDLAWFQPTPSGYFQLGLFVRSASDIIPPTSASMSSDGRVQDSWSSVDQLQQPLLGNGREQTASICMADSKKTGGGLIDNCTVKSLNDRKGLFFPFTSILYNVRPFGHQDVVGLMVSILLLGDLSLTLLTFLQFFSISIASFLIVLLILPLALLVPFFTGIIALFSQGPERSADHARIYALWNATSITNITTAVLVGIVHYKIYAPGNIFNGSVYTFNITIEEGGWWMFSGALFICKVVQARVLDRHIANLEIRDRTVYSKDPAKFWDS